MVAKERRRKQVADLIERTANSLEKIAIINNDIMTIEEGTRLVSLVALLERLASELKGE
jgi:hypothetical protein